MHKAMNAVGSKRNGGGRFTGIQNNAVARSTIESTRTVQPYPKDSAIYWDRPVSKHSIKDVKPKKNGEVCVLV